MGLRLAVMLSSLLTRLEYKVERGDVPGWVLIVLMTSALVVAIWGVARGRLIDIVQTSLSTVCGKLGC